MKKVYVSMIAGLLFLVIGNISLASAEETPTSNISVDYVVHPEINGHNGFQAVIVQDGVLDKPILFHFGYDKVIYAPNEIYIAGAFTPEGYQLNITNYAEIIYSMVAPLNAGYDVIILRDLDSALDIYQNAENFAYFMQNYIPCAAKTAILGKSLGGVIVRTAFAMYQSDLGVDYFVSIDAPQHGVFLSNWITQAPYSMILPLFFELSDPNRPSALQLLNGTEENQAFFESLNSLETGKFMKKILAPMTTIAVPFSNDLPWSQNFNPIHGKYFDVSSFQVIPEEIAMYFASLGFPLPSVIAGFIPYHSSALLKNGNTHTEFIDGEKCYVYNFDESNYFDHVIPASEPKAHSDDIYGVSTSLLALLQLGF